MTLSTTELIVTSLSVAFVIVEIIGKPYLKIKPFNCIMCMTGWMAMMIAFLSEGSGADMIRMAFIGWFVGAMFEAIKMRWL